MNITFPTRPGAHQPGTPLRAAPCRCIGGSLIPGHADTCLGCGHYEASTVEHARAMGGYMQQVAETHSWQVIKQHLTPAVREVVYGMFSHRIGLPERDDDSTSEAA